MGIQQIKSLGLIIWIVMMGYTYAYSQASNIGTPPISNFYKKNYKGSPQNWDITQNKTGILYFANNSGLLEFDGIHWRSYNVSNQTVVRSVKIAPNGRIYVGAQGELGYFSPNNKGQLSYHSLKYLLQETNQNFADVWDIEILDERVLFNTGNMILDYKEEQLKIIYQGQSIDRLSKVEDDFYMHDTQKGLFKLVDQNFVNIDSLTFIEKEVSGILPIGKDSLLISTLKNGLYLYANNQIKEWLLNDNGFIKDASIYCTTKIDEHNFGLGTSKAGIFIINKNGQVVRHINRKFGLQVNNVLSLFTDQSKNLWAGLDNGIDLIETNSPFSYIFPDGEMKSTGYAIEIFDNQIYFGTTSGVYTNEWKSYYNPLSSMNYDLVTNTDGQVWDLSVHYDNLILNHHEGVFKVEKDLASKISPKNGAWMQIPIQGNKLLSGHYNGLSILERNGEWQETFDFQNNWRESCRIIVEDSQGNIWVSHPYRGVFKVQFDANFTVCKEVKLYNSKNGFPSDLQIYVFKIGQEAVFCAENGIYSYNSNTDRFEPNEKWNSFFGENTRVQRLIEAKNGDIWFVTDKEVGVLEVTDGGIYKHINKRNFPQLIDKVVTAFEEIYSYDDDNVFIAHETGFIHYDPTHSVADTNFNVLIRLVQTIHTENDSIIYSGNVLEGDQATDIDYINNALRFAFSATYFGNIENNQFQYQLVGYDEKWSSWSNKPQIEYTNLKAGNYTFQVRAKNINNHLSNIATYQFRILPPWYATKLAFILYACLIAAGIFFLVFIPKKKYEREKAVLESEQKKTLLQKEQEHQLIEQQRQQQISKLEKEKLELQIQSKNQELASSTMHIVQKGEILRKLKEDIKKIAKSANDKDLAKQLEKVIQKVSADERLDEDWSQFAKHFDQVHSQFLQRLRSDYPQLTPKDRRLCAYLRMNLSSKEMAALMNISVRSVEVARYRLRKKLALDSEINLVEFMMQA